MRSGTYSGLIVQERAKRPCVQPLITSEKRSTLNKVETGKHLRRVVRGEHIRTVSELRNGGSEGTWTDIHLLCPRRRISATIVYRHSV